MDVKEQDENKDENQMTPKYQLQSNPGPFLIAELLRYYSENHNIRKNRGEAPSYQEMEGKYYI